MTGRDFGWLGIKDGVGLVEIGVEGSGRSVDVMEISRPGDVGNLADLGLTLAQGKQLVALVQQEIIAAQSRDHAAQRPSGRCVAPGELCAKSRITALTRLLPCSVRSRSGCPASAAPAAAGRRLGTAGRRIAARRDVGAKLAAKVANWAEYDAALRRRGNLTVWVTPEAIAAWVPAATGRRCWPQDYSDIAIESGLLLRLAFGRPWRQTEGMLGRSWICLAWSCRFRTTRRSPAAAPTWVSRRP